MAREATSEPSVESTPEYWTVRHEPDGDVLSFAVRGGRYQLLIVLLGAMLVVSALGLAAWLLLAGSITIGALVFVVIVPGACLALGAHCLDIALRARTEYRLAPDRLTATRYAIWGNRSEQVARSRVTRITRRYSPPASGMPAGTRGTWGIAVLHRDDGDRDRELHVDGTHSSEEATWLRKLLAGWAGVSTADPEPGSAASAPPAG